jgi:predicted SAM-dependent methyltransferase
MKSLIKENTSQLCLNVASGYETLAGFVNLDNSIFLHLLPVYTILKPLISNGHREWFEKYRDGKRRAELRRHNCLKELPYADGTVSHLLCSHFLEHVHRDQGESILRDFHRVLSRGGTLHIIVPDLAYGMELYEKVRGSDDAANAFLQWTILTRESKPSIRYRILETFGSFGLQHRWLYDYASLSRLLRQTGFTICDRIDSPSMHWRINDEGQVNILATKE